MDIPYRLPVLLAGAIGDKLIKKGIPSGRFPEESVLSNPEIYKSLVDEQISCGADILCMPTEYVNGEKLKSLGLDKNTAELNQKIVMMSKEVADGKIILAGCLSSTGKRHDNFDETEFFDMFYIFLDQAEALAEAGADLIVVEDMESLMEARAAVFACKRLDIPVFVIMLINDNDETPLGSDVLSSLICLQEIGIAGFGISVDFCDDNLDIIIDKIIPYAKIPIIVKMNGDLFNTKDLYSKTECLFRNGVQMIETGKNVNSVQLDVIRKSMDNYDFKSVLVEQYETQIVLSNDSQVFFLSTENIKLSEPVPCSVDMSDIIFEMNETNYDVIMIELLNYDDAVFFSQNAHMLRLPVIFKSESRIALETALILFTGRAMIDSDCSIDRYDLECLAKKYGDVVY